MNPKNDELLRSAHKTADIRLGMRKNCLRFRCREDLLDDAIVRLIASTSVDETIQRYEGSQTGA